MRQRAGPLDLGNDKRTFAQALGRRAHCLDVGRRLHERLAHRVHAVLQREFETGAVVFGERADAQVDARQVQPLAGAQFATHDHFALHVRAGNALDDELHEAVVEEQPVAWLHHLWQPRETHRHALGGADDVVAGQDEPVVGPQLDRLGVDPAQAHLGPGQIGHDRHAQARGPLDGAEAGDAFAVAGEIAVGEIEPRDVQPGADQPREHFRGFGGRSDGRDDLGLPVRQ